MLSSRAQILLSMTVVALWGPGVWGGQSSQAPARPQAPWLPGALTGRVVAADTGEPLRAAAISAVPVDSPGTAVASTSDAEGRFELKNMEPGSYRLMAYKPGFARTAYGSRSTAEDGRLLQVTAGRVVNVSDFKIARGGIITGRVLDEFGDAVVDARVIAGRPVPGGPWYATGTAMASTDDRGEYRLSGLAGGDYHVQARALDRPMGEVASLTPLEGPRYRQTFFPNRTSVDEAQRIAVRAGEHLSNIDIVLALARYYSVSGIGLDPAGRPAKLASVALEPQTGEGSAAKSIVQVDGTFQLTLISPGAYTLSMVRRGEHGTDAIATTPITVGDADVKGVVLTLGPTGGIRGRVELDPPGVAFRMSQLRAVARPSSRGIASIRSRDMVIGDDGAFALDGLLGPTRVGLQGLPAGWRLKSVLVGDRDMTGEDLAIGPSEVTGDVRIVITDRLSAVTGVVLDSRGARVEDYAVILFAEDRRRWVDAPSGSVALALRGADGGFAIAHVLPGAYYVIALDAVEPGRLQDAAFLESLWPLAAHIVLSANAPQQVSLKLTRVP